MLETSSREALADPSVFGGTARFEIRRRLGAGAMGIVYEAFDRDRGAAVALKALRGRTPQSLLRFKHEVRGLVGISHPNLVALHGLHEHGEQWFVTMELLDAVDLASHVRPNGVLALDRLESCLVQLARGVSALHAHGKLHRDIKPSNVLVTRDGRVVLIDFGVIAELGRATADGFVGTPAYAAPEQAAGEASPASDWYSVGVVLHELLAGGRPFVGSAKAIVFDKTRYDAPSLAVRNPDAPPRLAALCDALLRRDPAARAGADDIARAVGAHVSRRFARGTVAGAPGDELLVGRDGALGVLRDALDAAERGNGRTVHVRGVSGIGKSTLLRAFAAEAEATGAVVLAGRCYAQESVPYKAVDSLVDALGRHLATLPRGEAEAVLPRDIQLLARVFPTLATVDAIAAAPRRRAHGSAPAQHEVRRRAFAALRDLIARLAERRTLVLVIDDLQWGDLDSMPILDALVAPPDPPRVVLALAYRAEDEPRAPLVRALREHRERLGETIDSVEVTLEPLTVDEARAVAAATVDGERATQIAIESGGVPFLVHELVHASRGADRPSLDRVIAHRLDALGEAERDVLELIALAARPVTRSVLARASTTIAPELERAIANLVAARLARIAPAGDALECYHDRVREAVAAAVAPHRSRTLHARLADAVAAAPACDVEAAAAHYEAAGDRARAAEHALAAARHAHAALAFDRAARLYRSVLQLAELDPDARRELQTALGDVLAHAGRGTEAATTYLAAASDAPIADAVELRRRAASQLLRTGRIENGLLVLDHVLADTGGVLRRSPRRALASLAWNRGALRLRGTRYTARDATTIARSELARLDVLWTAATDLGMVDLVAAADFSARQLRVALALGEPIRVARALVAEAMFLAVQGERTARRRDRVLAQAEVLVDELGDRELPAWIDCTRGIAQYQAGRFRRALDHAEACIRRLREDCTGVLWQVGGVEVHAMWSLFYLGHLDELAARVDALAEQARSRGNRFDAANVGTGLPALAWAVADRTARGRTVVDEAMAAWAPRGFHLQHYYALLALASFDLYDGDAAAAHARVEATWSALERSRLLVCPSVAIEAHHLRARAAIAHGGDAAPIVRALAAYKLRGHPWADAMLALARAGACTDRDEAVRLLAHAIEACVRGELAAFAAAARRRRGELAGGASGAALVARADQELRARGVRAPDKLARMLVPLSPNLEPEAEPR